MSRVLAPVYRGVLGTTITLVVALLDRRLRRALAKRGAL